MDEKEVKREKRFTKRFNILCMEHTADHIKLIADKAGMSTSSFLILGAKLAVKNGITWTPKHINDRMVKFQLSMPPKIVERIKSEADLRKMSVSDFLCEGARLAEEMVKEIVTLDLTIF